MKTHKILCELQTCVIEYDARVLTTELERDILQVRLHRPLHHLPPGQRPMNGGQFLNLHVRGHGVADGGAMSIEELMISGGKGVER